MAQRIQTLWIDDLDGSEAEGTVRFGLDGAAYEIDLNSQHAEALRTALGAYVEHARKASNGAPARHRANGTRITKAGVDGTAQREYLALLGHDVKARGRIPAHLAAIPVPPRAQWPSDPILAAKEAELTTRHTGNDAPAVPQPTFTEPLSPAERAAKAAADILPPEPAPAEPEPA
jgi:hypothetical protein